MNTKFQDQPSVYPKHCPDGKAVKTLAQTLLERRATSHFKSDPVPEEYLDAILQFAAQAPSGYNLQPWRFIVVREKVNRQRLQRVAFNQEKISEAPVILIAFAIKDDWKNYIDDIFQEGIRRGFGQPEMLPGLKKMASDFLETQIEAPIWLNRHTMIAVTTMMLVAESYGLDTAPMEGFDPEAIRREFGLPDQAEIVALLAMGYGKGPDKPYCGRLALAEMVYDENLSRPWNSNGKSPDLAAKEASETIVREMPDMLEPA